MPYLQKFQRPIFLILSITCMLTYTSNSQQMPPSPSVTSDCINALFNLTDCLPYVQAGSNVTQPDKACCPELAGLIDSNPICLCELLAGAAESYGISVDNSRALALPKVCHVSTPPVSTCAVLGIPVSVGMSPTEAPSPFAGGTLPGSMAPAPVSENATGSATGIDFAKLIFSAALSVILTTIAVSAT